MLNWKEGEFECVYQKPRYDTKYFKLIFSKSDPDKKYMVLYRKGEFEMGITEYLLERYKELLPYTEERVLILGLGLALCDRVVKNPVYIERCPEIIRHTKTIGEVIYGDACKIELDEKFDVVFNDITGYDRDCNFDRFLRSGGKLIKFRLC